MTYAGDVGPYFDSVGKSYSGDFSLRGVRLFGGLDGDLGANAAFLRRRQIQRDLLYGVDASLQSGRFGLIDRFLSAVSYQLVECRYCFPPFLNSCAAFFMNATL